MKSVIIFLLLASLLIGGASGAASPSKFPPSLVDWSKTLPANANIKLLGGNIQGLPPGSDAYHLTLYQVGATYYIRFQNGTIYHSYSDDQTAIVALLALMASDSYYAFTTAIVNIDAVTLTSALSFLGDYNTIRFSGTVDSTSGVLNFTGSNQRAYFDQYTASNSTIQSIFGFNASAEYCFLKSEQINGGKYNVYMNGADHCTILTPFTVNSNANSYQYYLDNSTYNRLDVGYMYGGSQITQTGLYLDRSGGNELNARGMVRFGKAMWLTDYSEGNILKFNGVYNCNDGIYAPGTGGDMKKYNIFIGSIDNADVPGSRDIYSPGADPNLYLLTYARGANVTIGTDAKYINPFDPHRDVVIAKSSTGQTIPGNSTITKLVFPQRLWTPKTDGSPIPTP